MKIEIRKTKEDGVIQITTLDERFYAREKKDGTNEFNPSITWVGHYSPMGVGLLKYYAKHGWDEAELLKNEAAEHGTKTHQAIEILIRGGEVKMDSEFTDQDKEKVESLTPHEYWNVMTFERWWSDFNKEHTVEVIDTEKTVWVNAAKGEQYGYAGTRDMKLVIDGRPAIIDVKTSQDVYLSHEIQLSALKHGDPDSPDIYVLQVGYRRNKNGYKLTLVEDKFHLFQSAFQFWKDANPDTKPKQKDYPPTIKLVFSKKDGLYKCEHKNTHMEGDAGEYTVEVCNDCHKVAPFEAREPKKQLPAKLSSEKKKVVRKRKAK